MAEYKKPKWAEPEIDVWEDAGDARPGGPEERPIIIGIGGGFFGCFPRQFSCRPRFFSCNPRRLCYPRPCFPI
ncbi:hypothetical protein HSX37_09435|uniref:Uncharacterized protein n=1 Tax=Dendrosporobacter quercicolus TaxID=146817 RepID=A0A1G9QI10_9FIRM|nr:hypothetical protein [Dendrosporobacter quercicolus]NSL48251.1 hypothetical protein [Dendrosporobacter quercicolus DSM 1736]SDM10616.1 hypothetical protein SAMN04488502_102182 [Dendrosporobacter quercicolus]